MALDIPGGVFISRFGDKFAMLAGTALIGVVAIGASLSSSPREYGLETAFYVQAAMGFSASALMFISVRNPLGSEDIEAQGLGGRLVSTVSDHRSVFLAASLPIIALGELRQARQVFLPLWGDSIGLDVAQIGLVVSAATFADAVLFYPVGLVRRAWVCDAFGDPRKPGHHPRPGNPESRRDSHLLVYSQATTTAVALLWFAAATT